MFFSERKIFSPPGPSGLVRSCRWRDKIEWDEESHDRDLCMIQCTFFKVPFYFLRGPCKKPALWRVFCFNRDARGGTRLNWQIPF
jgi:hypothetical protein